MCVAAKYLANALRDPGIPRKFIVGQVNRVDHCVWGGIGQQLRSRSSEGAELEDDARPKKPREPSEQHAFPVRKVEIVTHFQCDVDLHPAELWPEIHRIPYRQFVLVDVDPIGQGPVDALIPIRAR